MANNLIPPMNVLSASSAKPTPGETAFGRLKAIQQGRGAYQPAAISFGQDQVLVRHAFDQAVTPQSSKESRFQAFARRAVKTGLVLASTILGGIFGGPIGAALSLGGSAMVLAGLQRLGKVRTVQNTVSPRVITFPGAQKEMAEQPDSVVSDALTEEAPLVGAGVKFQGASPFAQVFKSAEDARQDLSSGMAPDALAKARLRTVIFGNASSDEPVSRFHTVDFSQIKTSGQTEAAPKKNRFQGRVKNLASGMVPFGAANPFAAAFEQKATLKFKAITKTPPAPVQQPALVSELKEASSLSAISLHNVTEPMAIVTLSKDSSTVETYEPTKDKLGELKEAIVWGDQKPSLTHEGSQADPEQPLDVSSVVRMLQGMKEHLEAQGIKPESTKVILTTDLMKALTQADSIGGAKSKSKLLKNLYEQVGLPVSAENDPSIRYQAAIFNG